MYLDLDCRFDVLRLAQILRNRIAEGCRSAHLRNGDPEPENNGTKDEFQCSLENTLFSDCMQRFLYARCCNSPEFIAALKTVQSQSRREVSGAGIYFVMIDRRTLQSITESVVHELRKLLQLQPALVLVTKAPIYGEGTTTANDFNRVSSKYMLGDSTGLGYSRQGEEKTVSNREYMPSIWQSFITHRINLQVEEAEVPSVLESEVLPMHTSEWVQPCLKMKEKFSIMDDGVSLIQ
ncbi:hypothetical protein SORBI_3003G370300 [Sorghum bicolor]|nr:hypothetical protein SORBI_3003G370300 [Sorghum bicolor]